MILLSAGHHPAKPGACFENFCEHNEAVKWMEEIHQFLGSDVAKKVPTGVLKKKIEFINANEPTIAAEIHFNSLQVWNDANANGLVDKGEMEYKGSGALTLFYPGSSKGKRLATVVQEGMETVFKKHWRGVMEGYYRMDPKYGPDYFLVRTKCPSIIIEPEFIHHREEIESKRADCCTAIADGLLKAERALNV